MRKILFCLIISVFIISCSQSPTESERPSISILFRVYEDAFVSLIIYDQFDMLVKTLINEQLSANYHSISWDCRNENGQTVASGLYYYTLKAGEYETIREMIILK